MLTRELCNGHVNIPLSSQSLEICLASLEFIVRAIKGEENRENGNRNEIRNEGSLISMNGNEDDSDNGSKNHENDDDNDSNVEENNDDEDEDEGTNDNDDNESGNMIEFLPSPPTHHRTPTVTTQRTTSTSTSTAIKSAGKTISLEDLLPLFLPDQGCVLHSSDLLNVDDAPWISATLPADGDNSAKLVHSRISPLDALLLGALSLKGKFLSGEEVLCPNPKRLSELLFHDSVNEVLRDLISMANNLNASSIEVLYDQRTHPVERLMHPGLAQAQGPAITVYIKCSNLDKEAVCRLIEPSETLSNIIDEDKKGGGLSYLNGMEAFASGGLHGMNAKPKKSTNNNMNSSDNNYNSNSGGNNNNNSNNNNNNYSYNSINEADSESTYAIKQYPRTGGRRLMTAFAITDCLQIITGKDLFIFDPLGSHLITEDKSTDSGEGVNVRTRSQTRTQNNNYQSTESGQSGMRGVVTSRGRTTGIGQHYDLGGSRNASKKGSKEGSKEDILAKFPDQFSSLVNLPFGEGSKITSGGVNGLLIRMVLLLYCIVLHCIALCCAVLFLLVGITFYRSIFCVCVRVLFVHNMSNSSLPNTHILIHLVLSYIILTLYTIISAASPHCDISYLCLCRH